MAETADVKALLLQVDANLELMRQGLADGERQISRWRRDTEQQMSAVDRAFAQVGRGLGPLKASLGGLAASAAAIGVVGLGAGFLAVADQSKELTAQLKLATREFGSFSQAEVDAQRIARETRNGLAATVPLYTAFLRASEGMGRSQAEAARATETFSKALKIGGADANAAASATLQFSQALASGVLRGDEFNSIAEASPRILKLLADSIGVPTGQLRAMAAEGRLTADVLYTALTDTKFTAGIDAEFRQLPVTFDEAMTGVYDAAVIAFGAFDSGGEFSTAIANFVAGGADKFGSLADRAHALGVEIRSTFEGLRNVFDPLGEGGGAVMAGLGVKVQTLRDQVAGLIGIIDDIRNIPLQINQRVEAAVDAATFGNAGLLLADPTKYRRQKPVDSRSAFLRAYDAYTDSAERERVMQEVQDRFSGFGPDFQPIRRPRPAASSGGSGSKGRSGARASRRKTDADLSPMELILRDIGRQQLPLGIEFTGEKELVSANERIAALEAGLAEIDGFTKTVNIGDVLKAEDQERIEHFTLAFTDDLSRGLADAIVYGDNLGDVLVNSLKRAAAEAIASGLFDLLSGNVSGGAGGFLSKAAGSIGSFFTGLGFADGGRPPLNRASLVGERGPELFVPKVSGTIIPNHALGGGGTQMITVQVDKSALFDVYVQQAAAPLAAAAATRGAAGGAMMAEQRLNRRAMNTLR
ncbi:tape measure domain-containing protein [Sphingomonas laterariae]|uniref:Tape measure domain-containing protein n=1 Tax=Edaphosphingomonas laterariae TaxID=861865 RepID=A0A239JK12_9SPHN|nr:tape measure protein [Sphingomonas laterariae]SNT06165.1 tape measure domain-containing protein [Sphingomonas laterariae]